MIEQARPSEPRSESRVRMVSSGRTGGSRREQHMHSCAVSHRIFTDCSFPGEPADFKRKDLEMVSQERIAIDTHTHGQMHDLTDQVRRIVQSTGVRQGMVNVFNVGSTGAIGTIEFEPGLERDLPEMLDRLMPPSADYGHEQTWHDGNGHSHLQATTLGPSLTVPIDDGDLVLGTWQQIFHLECDIKPRKRTIVVTVYGEGQEAGGRNWESGVVRRTTGGSPSRDRKGAKGLNHGVVMTVRRPGG